jgi:cytochrome c peroxidase
MRTELMSSVASLFLAATAAGCGVSVEGQGDDLEIGTLQSALSSTLPNNKEFENPTGKSSSFSTAGSIDLAGSFFQSLGTNGRSCKTCHLQSDGWTVSARSAQEIFDESDGTAPLFEFDGQNCRGADRSTRAARRAASSLMIEKGLVRFDKAFPAAGEIEIIAAEGTYCNVTDALNHVVYRRPLPTVNFRALGTLLWDGLGNFIAPNPLDAMPVIFIGGTLLHAEGTVAPSNDQIAEGIGMMLSISNAQINDDDAGELDRKGALGGAENHASADLTGSPGFTIYDAWADLPGHGDKAKEREEVAAGQAIFNTRTFQIIGVGGLADRTGTCAGCHRVANQGNQSGFSTLNIGISTAARRTPDLPLYTLRNKLTGETTQTSDAGTATFTGLWADLGKFKVPMLRGLAARAPYFHDGSAKDLKAVVDFYNGRFNIGLTNQDKHNLESFLLAL